MVAFTKPALTFEAQVKQLLARGMEGEPTQMARRLSSVSYYRLSGYWYYRKEPGSENFRPGTHFDVAWQQYVFDRKLRLLVMDAIERIEVGVRTGFSYHQAHEFGPFGYFDDPKALPASADRTKLLSRVRDEIDRSKEPFLAHFRKKYGDTHAVPPIWEATEVLSFGCVLSLLAASPRKVQTPVSKRFNISFEVLNSWLWSLNEVRNVCAHHSRLWNRALGNKPKIPIAYHHPDWHSPEEVPNDRVFVILTICAYMLQELAPHSEWRTRAVTLLNNNAGIAPLKNMGFPTEWQKYALWT